MARPMLVATVQGRATAEEEQELVVVAGSGNSGGERDRQLQRLALGLLSACEACSHNQQCAGSAAGVANCSLPMVASNAESGVASAPPPFLPLLLPLLPPAARGLITLLLMSSSEKGAPGAFIVWHWAGAAGGRSPQPRFAAEAP